ncbi:MAG: 30S ribosomal protein S21 [Candidatus Omnitrophica bacterium]|nr:30S ribosomal protein S21 [Candidatus Omnitrophota bacterium]MCK4423764.1 30S ribosomal protein S21 [Candidatus Omnitrophota bacterium]
MSKVNVGQNEPLERALRRLKRKLDREGTMRELRERKHYEKPSEKRRKARKSSSR